MTKKQTKKKLPKLDTLVEDIYKTIGVLSEDKAINIPDEEYDLPNYGKCTSSSLVDPQTGEVFLLVDKRFLLKDETSRLINGLLYKAMDFFP